MTTCAAALTRALEKGQKGGPGTWNSNTVTSMAERAANELGSMVDAYLPAKVLIKAAGGRLKNEQPPMQKSKSFRAKFPPETLKEARETLQKHGKKPLNVGRLSAKIDSEAWNYDDESQFFSKYRNDGCYSATWGAGHLSPTIEVRIHFFQPGTEVAVSAPSEPVIAEVFEIFERDAPAHRIAEESVDTPFDEPEPVVRPLIFVGHGGKSKEWMELQNHLHHHHHYQVHAFESGARSGHAIRDILDNVVKKSDFALLVFTAEDDMADGSKRARENVVHETGLFQGRLGFHRAIVLLEKGIDLFSNLDGIQYISFSKGNIKETYGDILATLRREFGDAR